MHATIIFVGAIAAGIGFVIPAFWPFSLLGFIPLFQHVRTADLKSTLLFGSIFGFVFYGLAFWSVFWHTIPLDWVGTELPLSAQYFFVGVAWLYATLTCTLSAIAFTFLVRRIATGRWIDLISIPSAWIITEYAGLLLLSVTLLGPSSLLGPHIAFAVLGQLLAENVVLIQAAALGGMSMLSFLVIAVNVLGVRIISAPPANRRRYVLGALVLFILVAGLGYLIPTTERGTERLRVALVKTDGTPYPTNHEEESAYGTMVRELLFEARDADLIVLPEAAAFLGQPWSPRTEELTELLAPSMPTILDSRALQVNDTWQRVVEYYESAHERSTYAFKYFLAPYGEYLPFAFRTLARITGYHDAVAAIDASRMYVRGNEAHPAWIDGTLVGTILCQEAVSPTIAREQVRRGAEILINPNSLVWYHGSESMNARMVRHAQVRAVESGRPLLQIGDVSPSLFINRYGRVVAQSSPEQNILFVDVMPARGITPYVAWGNWWLLLPLILIVWILVRPRLKKA